jgi:hypothetical protein
MVLSFGCWVGPDAWGIAVAGRRNLSKLQGIAKPIDKTASIEKVYE